MAKLAGDVEILGLSVLLEGLVQNRREGTLVLAQGDERKAFHLSPAGIRLLRTTRRTANTLGDILIRTRKLSRGQLSGLLDRQKGSPGLLGETIVAEGILSRGDIETALKVQVEEEIYEAFLWAAPSFGWTDGPPPPPPPAESPVSSVILDAGLPTLMLEAARRCDEIQVIRRVLPDDDRILLRTDRPFQAEEGGDFDPELAAELMARVDGERTVGDVVRESLQTPFAVLRQLCLLVTGGHLRVSGLRVERTTQILRRTDPAPEEPVGAAGARILLVISDMPTYRKTLCAYLAANGYHPVEAVTRAEMSDVVARVRAEGVVLDGSVASPEALRVCERLRGLTAAPVLFLTANPTKEAVVRAIRSGARDCLVKPFPNAVLLERLAAMLKS